MGLLFCIWGEGRHGVGTQDGPEDLIPSPHMVFAEGVLFRGAPPPPPPRTVPALSFWARLGPGMEVEMALAGWVTVKLPMQGQETR